MAKLTHLNQKGEAAMVDVSAKAESVREAEARARVLMSAETLALVRSGSAKKGDVLAASRIAGIMAAKKTADLIPLCHPLPLDKLSVDFVLDEADGSLEVIAMARTTARTGVEMEAMTAASVAALTVYDMVKSAERGVTITDLRLTRKSGGKSGDYRAD